MPKLLTLFTARTLVLLTLLASNAALAQDSRWFRVELLIFTNASAPDAPAGAAITEQWDATPALAYPDAARFLIDPAQVVAANSSGLPQPFVQLPSSYQEFRGKAAVMQRNGSYNVLFHETWVQPVPPEARALPIVLDRSGDTRMWPRLQGSIKLYLSRYLQVETNLWLNTAGTYLPGTWQMPAPPLGPPSLVIEEPFPEPPTQAVPGEAVPTAASPVAQATVAAATDTAGNALQPLIMEPEVVTAMEEEVLLETGPVYPYRHAVLLQQKRRMRSNEVHYIDHPLFGLVIKFTPITAEELAAIALKQGP